MDFGDLKRIVEETVICTVDRRHLNFDVPFSGRRQPDRREHRGRRSGGSSRRRSAPARLVRVTLHETERNMVVYEGEKA